MGSWKCTTFGFVKSPPPKNANFSCRSHASQIKSLKKNLPLKKKNEKRLTGL